MKTILKYSKYAVITFITITGFYLINLFLMKPVSIDHYLGKEVVMEMLDTPEMLTYLGILDPFNFITKHQSKLSNNGLEDLKEDLEEMKQAKKILERYDDSKLSQQQSVTKKIALYDLENNIKQQEQFPFHNYPLNQIGGIHLNMIQFMTDIHPIRSSSLYRPTKYA